MSEFQQTMTAICSIGLVILIISISIYFTQRQEWEYKLRIVNEVKNNVELKINTNDFKELLKK